MKIIHILTGQSHSNAGVIPLMDGLQGVCEADSIATDGLQKASK